MSIYKLAADVLRVAGPPAQEYLGQGADLLEQVKNLYLHPDHPAVGPVMLRLGLISLILFVVPAWIQVKAAWAYLGLEFFVLWRVRELYPEYRRALTPAHLVLLGAPTDAQYATFLLHRRAVEGRPLRGAKTLKRAGKQRARAASDAASFKEDQDDDVRSTYSATRSAFGFGRTHSPASSIAEHEEDAGDVVGSKQRPTQPSLSCSLTPTILSHCSPFCGAQRLSWRAHHHPAPPPLRAHARLPAPGAQEAREPAHRACRARAGWRAGGAG